ncbi:Hypothetical protein R9X50_00328000 [Acrodontium crateriforme]|uniref:Uncharacterized protein n=1 Tax=Acrodontium crateriforme TaxID=150365 RepID=A0AAQ3R9B3_9PEZI|nr:Hypothetical protein R9X50_00328000 [Acrodontium crateriforme]
MPTISTMTITWRQVVETSLPSTFPLGYLDPFGDDYSDNTKGLAWFQASWATPALHALIIYSTLSFVLFIYLRFRGKLDNTWNWRSDCGIRREIVVIRHQSNSNLEEVPEEDVVSGVEPLAAVQSMPRERILHRARQDPAIDLVLNDQQPQIEAGRNHQEL